MVVISQAIGRGVMPHSVSAGAAFSAIGAVILL